MDSKNLNDWLQAVGIFAVAVTLMFEGLQMKQDWQLAEVQFFAESDDTLSIAAFVEERPQVWIAGLRGDELSPEDEAVFRNILMAARFSYASFYEGQMRLGSLVPGWVSRKFAYQLFSNPGLRRLWNQRREFDMRQFSAYKKDDLPTRFEVEVANYVEELDRNGVQPSDIAMYQIW